jgi:uncharacterized protein (DUF305 family)
MEAILGNTRSLASGKLVIRTATRFSLPALLAVVAGACSSSQATRPGTVTPEAGPQAAAAPARRANRADVEFMSGMIHHHAQAIVMAKWSATHGASERIQILSQRIIVSQTDEIKSMQQWLREKGEPAPEPSPTGQKMMLGGVEHDMLMPGMLTPEQMTQLDRARGTQFDRLFLTFMIQHHEGALTMVDKLLGSMGGGADDFIYKVASDTFADQGSEIDRMQKMLDAMGPG